MNEETKTKISKKFQDRREEISKEIYSNIEKLANLKTLKEAQVNMLSLRQRLLEDTHTILEHITSLRKKYQANEKNIIIDGRTSSIKESLEILENQVTFFNESIKTIDNIIFGIKTRLDIEKTLGL